MDVPTPYLINDTRKIDFFKKTTFSNYLKKDVFETLFKKIDEGKLADVCQWTCECIVSGYQDELWERVITYYSKYININSPFLPYHFYHKLVLFLKLKADEHFTKHFLDLRNSQEVRNHFCELTCLLTNASKSRKSIALPKISKKDFQEGYFKERLKAKDFTNSMKLLEKGDPKELHIVINEFANRLTEYQYNEQEAIYWLIWMLEWERLMVLKIGSYECATRNLNDNVEKKYCKDVIWVFWFVILKEMETRNKEDLSNQIKSLFEFYKFKYTPSKKKKRLPLLLNCIQLLCPQVELNITKYPIFEKYYLTLQACANINVIYKELKKDENMENDYVNSKMKQDATFVVTKYEDVSNLNDISKYRQELKAKKDKEKEYKRYLEQQKLQNRKNREEKTALKKCLVDKIDTHIINTSNIRPIISTSSKLEEKIKEKRVSFQDNKTLSMIEKIDQKLKIKDETSIGDGKSKIGKTDSISVIKTN